jgi:hypothetical protein
MYVKNCLDCGVEFLAKRSDAKRCSKRCKQRAYCKVHPEKVAQSNRAYRGAHREKICEYGRAYYEANREKICESKRAYHAAYRDANREKLAEKARAAYRSTGTSTAMMSIFNAMKKLKEERTNAQP